MANFHVIYEKLGVSLVPLIAKIAAVAPATIFTAGTITTAAIAGMASWALTQPTGSLLRVSFLFLLLDFYVYLVGASTDRSCLWFNWCQFGQYICWYY